jgi:Na+/H+ antiporter NhaC
MQQGPNPLAGVGVLVGQHLVPQVMDGYNAGVLVLLGFIGGFVALMETSGGGAAFAARVAHWITSRARMQIAAWVGGVVVFFSDLGTPLIVGPAFRPLADRLRVSRAKLAYIVDSTASPVAILVPFIGWGVYVMSLLEQQFQALGIEQSDYAALVNAMPFQFYAWLAVLLVPLLALTGSDFGPMRRAEWRAQSADEPQSTAGASASAAVDAPERARASFVWLPLLVLGVVLLWTLVPLGFPFGRVSGADFRAGLSTAYVAAAVALVALTAAYRARGFLASVQVYLDGMGRMMQVAVMLLLAWALGDLSHALGADVYVAEVVQERVPGWLLPLLIFLVSAVISFATGSSWGTFAIMMPLALPAAVTSGAPLSVCIGAVLSGGLFGDHCSPISETTILSATGAGCEQYEHFQTQMPYAVANGLLCVGGFLVAGHFPSGWVLGVLLVAQVSALLVLRRVFAGGVP